MIIKVCGGIGDSLICSAVSSRKPVIVYCRGHQVELLNSLINVEARPLPKNGFVKGCVDMDMLFCSVRGLRNEDYYSLLEERVGFDVDLPKFSFSGHQDSNSVYLHTTPSDQNRAWVDEYWAELAYNLRDCGKTVYFLGTELDYGFSDRGIIKLSDISNNLLWQAKQIGGIFIGVDSGFCHISGILGIKGYVIFTNTYPKNVIGRYPTLQGIVADDFNPSMVCGILCKKSREYARKITPEAVLQKLGIGFSGDQSGKERNPLENLPEIGIIYNREYEDFAARIYSHLPGKKTLQKPRKITLEILDKRSILIKTPKSSGIFISSLNNLHRAINELLGDSSEIGSDLCQRIV